MAPHIPTKNCSVGFSPGVTDSKSDIVFAVWIICFSLINFNLQVGINNNPKNYFALMVDRNFNNFYYPSKLRLSFCEYAKIFLITQNILERDFFAFCFLVAGAGVMQFFTHKIEIFGVIGIVRIFWEKIIHSFKSLLSDIWYLYRINF